MNRIQQAFASEKAFIPFITGGDPNLETTKELVIAMEQAGADLIEIGLPFSDPVAEGIVIQNANERALEAGCTIDRLFQMITEARQTVTVPLVILTYINPVFTYGKERFIKQCVDSGIDGLIIPDLPYEEKEEICQMMNEYDMQLISMIAPTSRQRIEMIAKEAKGFIYVVSSLGVTGVRSKINSNIAEIISTIREVTSTPCAIGFGISKPEQAARMASISDGAIVGSAIVKMVEVYGESAVLPVSEYVREMKQAVLKQSNLC